MSVFSAPSFREHEQVAFWCDPAAGLKAIIAIHDTTLGPALGGCRMWPYPDEQAALEDVLRLSRGMTYKAAMAGLSWGGGKAVLLADPRKDKSPALFESFGRFVDSLGGRYITAEDVGITPADLAHARRHTAHVVGLERGSGDPSPVTAWGIFHGLRATVRHRLGRDSLDGLHVAVQGLGHVGQHLCRYLREAGAKLTVTDIDAGRCQAVAGECGAATVAADSIFDVAADVFAPCALGAVLNDGTISRLKVAAVAGAANNQLAEDRHGDALRRRGILYAPDYVINAGGIINISHEGPGYDAEAARAHAAGIGTTLSELFRRAEAAGVATNAMADQLAEERLAAGRAHRPQRRLAG